MRSIPILIIALMIAVFVPHVCAENLTYPQEYYDLNKQADGSWDTYHSFNGNTYTYTGFLTLFSKLSANQIALEKQNELINEQNELLKKLLNQTYSVHYSYMGQYQVDTDKGLYQIIPNH